MLTTAPTPVSTAQPNRAASSSGRSGSIFTQDSRATTAWVAKAATPRRWLTGSASERKPPLAGKQRSGGVGLGGRLAERRSSRRRKGRSGRSSARTPARRDPRPRGRSRLRRRPRRFPPPRGRAPLASGAAASRRSPTGPSGRGPPPRSSPGLRRGRAGRGRARRFRAASTPHRAAAGRAGEERRL